MRRTPICVIGLYLCFALLAFLIFWAASGHEAGVWVALATLALLAVCAVWTSVSVLARGRVYLWLRPKRRPRRWVLICLMQLFAVFCLWFPVWIERPQAVFSKALTLLFGIDFFVSGIVLKWLTPLVDRFVVHKGWSLR
jgi:hypothetical protein